MSNILSPATATAPYGYGSWPPAPVAAPQPVYDQFAAPSAQAGPSDPFAPQAPAMHDPYAPNPPAPPTFNDISSTIMGAYGASDVGSTAQLLRLHSLPMGHPNLNRSHNQQQ